MRLPIAAGAMLRAMYAPVCVFRAWWGILLCMSLLRSSRVKFAAWKNLAGDGACSSVTMHAADTAVECFISTRVELVQHVL